MATAHKDTQVSDQISIGPRRYGGGMESADLKRTDNYRLFVYGTLQFPSIIHALIGRVPAMTPSWVIDFEVRELRGESYPGMIPVSGGLAHGSLLTLETKGEWEVLNDYEDDVYEPILVEAFRGPGISEQALSFRVPLSLVTGRSWKKEEFEQNHLASFLGDSSEN